MEQQIPEKIPPVCDINASYDLAVETVEIDYSYH
jgi:hypothetical protein